MSFVEIYLLCALGIVISIVLPILRKALPIVQPTGLGAGERVGPSIPALIWAVAKPYLIVGLFSLLTALLIVVFIPGLDARAALLAGYAWDSTIQKLKG